jgi:CRP-like cAMP-binding protein
MGQGRAVSRRPARRSWRSHANRHDFAETASQQAACELPAADYRRVSSYLEPIDLPADRVLLKSGRPIHMIYFLGQGVCSITQKMRNGTRIEVASVGHDGFVGFDALFSNVAGLWEPVVSIPDGAALAMGANAFRHELALNGYFARAIRRYAHAFIGSLAQSVACNAIHSVEKRCARWLLTMRDRLGRDDFPFTQEVMAARLGVRRPTVTLVVGTFQEMRLVDYGGGRWVILNRTALKSASCECYDRLKK